MTRSLSFLSLLVSFATAGCQIDDGASLGEDLTTTEELAAVAASGPRLTATAEAGGTRALAISDTPSVELDSATDPEQSTLATGADCTGSVADAWRSWTPRYLGAPLTMVNPIGGYLDGQIVVHGGRQTVTTLNNTGGQTFVLPTPTCEQPNPDYLKVTVSGAPPLVWGAASTVAARRLWLIGGTSSGAGACRRQTSYFELTGPTSGKWVTIAALLPQGLCQAAATTMVDANGKEWIVVAGGSTRSLPNTSCAGGFAPTGPALRMDPLAASPTWVAQTGAVDDRARWGGAVATSADRRSTYVFGGSSSVTIAGGATSDGSKIVLGTSAKPVFSTAPALPAAHFAAAAATWSDGGFSELFVSGGSTTLGPATGCTGSSSANIPGTAAMWSFDPASGLFTERSAAPSRRTGHVLVAVPALGQTQMKSKLYAIGGHDATTAAWTVDEYTP